MLLDDLYDIIELNSTDDTTLSATIKINKSHELFKGHFPENPVTPGVAMLQIIKNCLEIHLKTSLILKSLQQVKFLAIVNPEVHQLLNFTLQIRQEKDSIIVKSHTSFNDQTSVLKCNATFAKQY